MPSRKSKTGRRSPACICSTSLVSHWHFSISRTSHTTTCQLCLFLYAWAPFLDAIINTSCCMQLQHRRQLSLPMNSKCSNFRSTTNACLHNNEYKIGHCCKNHECKQQATSVGPNQTPQRRTCSLLAARPQREVRRRRRPLLQRRANSPARSCPRIPLPCEARAPRLRLPRGVFLTGGTSPAACELSCVTLAPP